QWRRQVEERRKERSRRVDEAGEAYNEALEQLWAVESEIAAAERELDAAQRAQLTPADSSAGVRAQRERVSAAQATLKALRTDLAIAQAVARQREQEYDELLAT